jgi:aspartate/methionine/tyrosine aminotransferase
VLGPERSRYLSWILALRAGDLTLDLTDSGLATPLERLEVDPASIRAAHPEWGGPAAIREALADHAGRPRDEVVLTLGTNGAIFLALAALLEPGGAALVEDPAYDPLWVTAEALGARVDRFPRRPEAGYAVEPDAVRAALRPDTRVVVTTDLHNPSARRAGDDALAELSRLMEERDGWVLVDEVYRDFGEGSPGTARSLGERIVTVSSLTKVYGFGGLRAGWLLGPTEIVERVKRLLLLFHVGDPAPAHPFTLAAHRQREAIRAECRARAARGWDGFRAWLASRGEEPPASDGGIHAWYRLPAGLTGTRVADELLARHRVAVVPGRFFGDDSHVRVGLGNVPDALRQGLDRLGEVIDGLRPPA